MSEPKLQSASSPDVSILDVIVELMIFLDRCPSDLLDQQGTSCTRAFLQCRFGDFPFDAVSDWIGLSDNDTDVSIHTFHRDHVDKSLLSLRNGVLAFIQNHDMYLAGGCNCDSCISSHERAVSAVREIIDLNRVH